MMDWIREQLSGRRSRTTGVVYLLYFLTAILGAVVMPGNANDIAAHQTLFRWGFAVSTISLGLYVAMTVLFYRLFTRVNRSVALLAAFFGLMGCALQAVGSLFQLAPLVALGGTQYKGAFNPDQLHAMAQILLDMSVQAGYIGIVFFGVFDFVIGYLIIRSIFLPHALGVLMMLAGLGWLIFLSPALANSVLIPIEVLGFVAELALMLWLVVFGVNVERWTAQGRLAEASVTT